MKAKKEKRKKKPVRVRTLRHQITAYFTGLLLLSILTITAINGVFLEKYYVSRKIDALQDMLTSLQEADIDNMMNSDDEEATKNIPEDIEHASARNNLSWVIIDSSNTKWLSWGENEKQLQSKLFGYIYDLDEDGEKSRILKENSDYTVQQCHDRFAVLGHFK